MEIRPFRAIRYNPSKVSLEKVVAPPYDVISTERQEELYKLSPYNIVRLILGKESPHDDKNNNRYTRAASYFREWLEKGILVKDEKEAIYIYEQTFRYKQKIFARTAVVARVELKELGEGIYPHERTMKKFKEDRYRLLEATRANFEPVFSLYDSKEVAEELLSEFKKPPPLINIVDERGVSDKVWAVYDKVSIDKIVSLIKGNDLFIADGHHRYETSLKFYKESPHLPGAKYVMMALVDMKDKGLIILPAHRVVTLNSKSPQELLSELKDNFEVSSLKKDVDASLNALERNLYDYIMVLSGDFYGLKLKNQELVLSHDFDVTILHRYILEDILEVNPSQVEARVIFTKNPEEAVNLASKPTKVSFLIKPTPLSALRKVARAHKVMPQKSTYFYPKLLSGLLINSLEES